MVRQIKRRIRKKKKLLRFRSQLIKLYEEFKTKTEKLSEEYGIEIGKKADIVIIDCESVIDAFRNQPIRKNVIKEGRIIAEGKMEKKLHRAIT